MEILLLKLKAWRFTISFISCFILPNMVLANRPLINMHLLYKNRSNQIQIAYFRLTPSPSPVQHSLSKCYQGSDVSDLIECCKSNPLLYYCTFLRQTCYYDSSTYPVCPDCSLSSDKDYCCFLNPHHSICSTVTDCHSHTDVAACCKYKWYTKFCTDTWDNCQINSTIPACPKNCEDSSEQYYCCDINPSAHGCPKDCKTASNIVECCKANSHSYNEDCETIRRKCSNSPHDPSCPDCSTSSDKVSCCYINSKHRICSSLIDCTLVDDVASCCTEHFYTTQCKNLKSTCYTNSEDPVCPKNCTNSRERHFCCSLNPAAEGCPTDCDKEWDVVECCRWNFDEFDHCQKIIKTCSNSSLDPICPDCENLALSHYRNTHLCCKFNPTHKYCSMLTTCASETDVAACCKANPTTAHCLDIATFCSAWPDNSKCPKDCVNSSEKIFCCELNPSARGCPVDCDDTEEDIVTCCKTNPTFDHCAKIISACKRSSEAEICPDCSKTSDRTYCCQVMNPTHNACSFRSSVFARTPDCKFSADVAACCKGNPSSAHCMEVAKFCPVSPDSSICPLDCSDSSERFYCCALNPAAEGCPNDCDQELDVVSCCKANPTFDRCLTLSILCKHSSLDKSCPDCSKTAEYHYCCEVMNPTHSTCSNTTDCKLVPDVAACCKAYPLSAHCKDVANLCPARISDHHHPTSFLCPTDCSNSLEKYFCCSLNPTANGCPE